VTAIFHKSKPRELLRSQIKVRENGDDCGCSQNLVETNKSGLFTNLSRENCCVSQFKEQVKWSDCSCFTKLGRNKQIKVQVKCSDCSFSQILVERIATSHKSSSSKIKRLQLLISLGRSKQIWVQVKWSKWLRLFTDPSRENCCVSQTIVRVKRSDCTCSQNLAETSKSEFKKSEVGSTEKPWLQFFTNPTQKMLRLTNHSSSKM
jgi:hypothetical protein